MEPILAVLLAGVLDAGTGDATPLSPEEILVFWEARDRALRRVRLSFHAATSAPGKPDRVRSTWDGVWTRDGSRVAVQWTQSDTDPAGSLKPVLNASGIWDGLRLEEFSHNLLTGQRTIEIGRRFAGPFTAWMPSTFGWGPPSGSLTGWPGLLKKWRWQILGEELVDGRPCLRVLWYRESHGKPQTPMSLWIDVSKTLLVWKYVDYALVKDGDSSGSLEISNVRFTPSSEYLLQDARKVREFWVPCRGRFRFLDNLTLDEVHVTMDPATVQLNEAPVEQDFKLPEQSGTIIYDEVRDTTMYRWGEKGTLTGEEIIEEEVLESVAAADGLKAARHPGSPQPLLKASCGPNALYFWLRLHGIEASLEDILSHVREDNGVSIQDLSDAAGKVGRPLAVVRVDRKDSGCPAGNFIAHLEGSEVEHKESHPHEKGHYVVARRMGRDVRLISVPGKPVTVSDRDFFRIWSGYALVPAENLPDPAVLARQRLLRGLYLGGGALLLLTGAVLLCRRWIRRAGTAAAGLVLVATAAVSGCSPSSKAANPLTVVGDKTHEFKPVPEGQAVNAEFVLRNDSSDPLALSLVKSCGCTTASLTPDVLKPGSEGRVKVYINTNGRGGGFNQFVDVLGRGRKLQTLWIVGKVIPGLRLVVEPRQLDLGVLRTGDEVRRPLSFEAISSGEKIPVRLESLASPPGAPLAWDVEWDPAEPRTETDFKMNVRQYFKGTLRVRAVGPGRLTPPVVQFANALQDPARRSSVQVGLSALVCDAFGSEPDAVFLGDLRSSESFTRSVVISPLRPLEGTPTFGTSAPWLSVGPVRALKEAFVVDVTVSPSGAAGLIRENVNVRWGDGTPLILPVVGMRRPE